MPAERTTMRHVREVLRLKFVGGVSTREIARRIGVAASTVRATIKRFQAAGLSWPVPEDMIDAALEARLFSDAGTKQGHRRRSSPTGQLSIASSNASTSHCRSCGTSTSRAILRATATWPRARRRQGVAWKPRCLLDARCDGQP
jgi:transposase-like protein